VFISLRQLQDQINPIRQKAKAKEIEKNRWRAATTADETKLLQHLNEFRMSRSKIEEISSSIDAFIRSKKQQALESIEAELSSVSESAKDFNSRLRAIEPEVTALKTQVNDQDGHRKNVEGNLELLDMIDGMIRLEDELVLLEEKKASLAGVESAQKEYDQAYQKNRMFNSEKDRKDGSAETLKAQHRELKVRSECA